MLHPRQQTFENKADVRKPMNHLTGYFRRQPNKNRKTGTRQGLSTVHRHPVPGLQPLQAWLFEGQLTRQNVFKIPRVGSGRVGSGQVGSGQEAFETSRVGPGYPDPTRPDSRGLTWPANSPDSNEPFS